MANLTVDLYSVDVDISVEDFLDACSTSEWEDLKDAVIKEFGLGNTISLGDSVVNHLEIKYHRLLNPNTAANIHLVVNLLEDCIRTGEPISKLLNTNNL